MFQFLRSSVGKKYVMALSGLGLVGFVIGHLLGNLQIFAGPDAINSYAQALKDLGPLLWVARIGLLVLLMAHLVTAMQLRIENQKARPVRYSYPGTIKATLSSRTMALTGLLIFAYIVYHLAHFTVRCTDPGFSNLIDTQGRHDVYRMIILGFSNPIVAATYIFAMFALAAHLFHGVSSVFQSLGLNSAKYRPITSLVGPTLSFVVFVGYGIIPLAVWLGWIK